jgi:hypothetical protein
MPSEAKPPSEPSDSGKIFPGEDVRTTSQVYRRSEQSEKPRPIKRDGPTEIVKTPAPGSKSEIPGPTSAEREAKPEVPRLTPELLLELIGLVGGKKPALLIPADSSEPVTETEFDQDKLWQYDIAIYDRDKVFLTKKTAELDYDFPNPLASKYVLERSDAAKDLDSRLDSPKKLYGDVYVLGYERVLEIITGLEGQLTELKHSLEWIDPSRGSD